jgi:thioredoxin 1
MSNAMALTKDNFDSTVASGVTLVDFWAAWCGPCKIIAPIVDEIAGAYEGRATVAKVDVDQEGALAEKFGVQSIPTLLIMKEGAEINRFIGVTSKEDLMAALDDAL